MRLAKCLSAAEEQYSEDSEIHHLGQSEVVVTRGLEQCLPCLRAVVKSLRKVHGKGCWPRSQCHSSSSRHCIHTAHTHAHTHAHTQQAGQNYWLPAGLTLKAVNMQQAKTTMFEQSRTLAMLSCWWPQVHQSSQLWNVRLLRTKSIAEVLVCDHQSILSNNSFTLLWSAAL